MSLPQPLESREFRLAEVGKSSLILGVVAAVLAFLPTLAGILSQGDGAYLHQQTALDDQMVYAAWMKQAAQGNFFFRNLFAIDPQPGLTIHLYFWALGLVSAVVGSAWTLTLARLGFGLLFVWMLGRLLVKLDFSVLQAKVGLILATFGAGLGWTMWEPFGRVVLGTPPTAALANGRLSIDVWQPEAFVFPSLLTNGLFMASLCLFLVIFSSALDAKESWKPVLPGAFAFLVLMNIHSYDVLLLALVLAGLAAASFGAGSFSWAWAGRVAAMGVGALPAAGWFLYVLSQDKVFQSRAATLTFSPALPQVFVGLLPFLIIAGVGLWLTKDEAPRRLAGGGRLLALVLVGWALGYTHNPDSYFMDFAGFGVALILALGALWLLGMDKPGLALLWAWAILGIVALGYPGLFQRKLAMGMAIPWALLAAWYGAEWLRGLENSRRLLYGGLACLVASLSSVLWLSREVQLARQNVSSTTIHSPTLDKGAAEALAALDKLPGRPVVLAMPGVARPDPERKGSFREPYLPDLNPMVAGIAGKVAYAGHWSETPEYDKVRRGRATSFFLSQTTPEQRASILADSGASFALAPMPASFPELPLAEPEALGKVRSVFGRWALVELAARE